ncbi:MAG: NAD(P)-dependent oxidoreductase [Crocinitomicaceae bacterium]|nr:NAD(P)-dependent oxidoreductase [Crocinitomicaceae bacterium]
MKKTKKILITGSNGLLGQKIVYNLKQRKDVDLYATSIGENRLLDKLGYTYRSLDITDQNKVSHILSEINPDVIINTAAMTNVDACEHNKEKCWKINVDAVKYLVEASSKYNTHFIHLSTDFVFDGKAGPYSETDEPNPLHYYAESKLASEKIVSENSSNWAIIRTIIIYGITDNMSRSNLVLWSKGEIEKGNTIKVVNDQFRSPTLAEDLAEGCISVADNSAQGIYHLSGPEINSILELIYKVADFYALDKSKIIPVTSASLNQPAKRPLRTGFVIDKAKKELGFKPRSFDEGIKFLDKQMNN